MPSIPGLSFTTTKLQATQEQNVSLTQLSSPQIALNVGGAGAVSPSLSPSSNPNLTASQNPSLPGDNLSVPLTGGIPLSLSQPTPSIGTTLPPGQPVPGSGLFSDPLKVALIGGGALLVLFALGKKKGK